jgi:hypothetical protein
VLDFVGIVSSNQPRVIGKIVLFMDEETEVKEVNNL